MIERRHNREAERMALVERIAREADRLPEAVRAAIHAPGVLAAMAAVPREDFVPVDEQDLAYRNEPLPIGHGQTISQPFIVALMTGLLAPRPTDRVLEIGTGSGYQAAVLSRLVAELYSIECVADLAERAKANLAAASVHNVSVRVGDGHAGWPEAAPFDGIIVTAAADTMPETLLTQLKPGGRLVIPLGTRRQMLVVAVRDAADNVTTTDILPVRFVPFVTA